MISEVDDEMVGLASFWLLNYYCVVLNSMV